MTDVHLKNLFLSIWQNTRLIERSTRASPQTHIKLIICLTDGSFLSFFFFFFSSTYFEVLRKTITYDHSNSFIGAKQNQSVDQWNGLISTNVWISAYQADRALFFFHACIYALLYLSIYFCTLYCKTCSRVALTNKVSLL